VDENGDYFGIFGKFIFAALHYRSPVCIAAYVKIYAVVL